MTMTAQTTQANSPKRKSLNGQFTIALRKCPHQHLKPSGSEAWRDKQEISTIVPKMVQHDSRHNITLAIHFNCAQLVVPMTVFILENAGCELSRWENEGGARPSAWIEHRAIHTRVSRKRLAIGRSRDNGNRKEIGSGSQGSFNESQHVSS